jgi:uncharacterized protein involved in exopolysaccharide biosynthesis
MKGAQQALSIAEDALLAFLVQNRRYQDSPQLSFEYNRLQRRVEQQQQLYTSILTAYEQARIEEVRNTPVITVLDSPEGTARRSGSTILNVVLGIVLGFVAAVIIAMAMEFVSNLRSAGLEMGPNGMHAVTANGSHAP